MAAAERPAAERTAPFPTPPSWAEIVRRGMNPPVVQPHPSPASRHSHTAHILQLYRDCVARGTWAKLILETRGGEEEINFFCSPQPGAAATQAAEAFHKQAKKKCPANKRRRERAKRRREAWREKKSQYTQAGNTTAAADLTAAAYMTTTALAADNSMVAPSAAEVAPVMAATARTAAARTATARTAAARTAAARTAAATTEAPEPGAARTVAVATAEDVEVGTAASAAACPSTATVFLRERSKACAGERRSSARASLLSKRRDSMASGSPENLRRANSMEEMNYSFRIELEPDEFQREEERDVAVEREREATSEIPPPPQPRDHFPIRLLNKHPDWFLCSTCLRRHHRINALQCVKCDEKHGKIYKRQSTRALHFILP